MNLWLIIAVIQFKYKFKYMICLFFIYILHLLREKTNSQCDQLPDGLIAHSVEHCTAIAEVMGSKPIQGYLSPQFKYMIFHIFIYGNLLCQENVSERYISILEENISGYSLETDQFGLNGNAL